MARRPNEIDASVGHLQEAIEKIRGQIVGLSAQRAGRLRGRIADILEELVILAAELDAVKEPTNIFDTSNPMVIGRFVAIALLAQEKVPLSAVPQFYGSGVYALYYNGDFSSYAPLVGTENPIYVGKTDPAIPTAKTSREQGVSLSRRLRRDHARSIRQAESTLNVEDFSCRFLVVKSGGQTEAENYLIHLFRPIWNNEMKICYGIGKHGDDPKTRSNDRSPWDTMHPGRDWAHRGSEIVDEMPKHEIVSKLAEHFEKFPPLKDINSVLEKFYAELKQR